MKVFVDRDESYPVYTIFEEEVYTKQDTISLTRTQYERYKKALKLWNEVQSMIAKKLGDK